MFTPLGLAAAVIGVALIFVNCILIALRWSTLPGQVPRHYGLTGKPDAWGRKGVIWGYPAISLIMFTLVWGVFLHERSKPGSTLGPHDTELMALMSGYVSLIMLIITIRTFAVAEERAEGLGWWLAPALAAGIVIMVARYT